jgi:hypothetical protein
MASKTPHVVTVRDNYQRVRPGPISPSSACLSCDTSLGYPWMAHTLFWYTSCRCGRVSSNSATGEATKFVRLHKSHMCQFIINACSTWPNIKIDLSLTFPFSILHNLLIARPGLIFVPQFNRYHKPHRLPLWEEDLSRAAFDHSTSTDDLHY